MVAKQWVVNTLLLQNYGIFCILIFGSKKILCLPNCMCIVKVQLQMISINIVKSRFFKKRELYWSNLPQNSNVERESFVWKFGVRIPVGEGQSVLYVNIQFLMENMKMKRKWDKKNLTIPDGDLNSGFLNKFPLKIWILREIKSIKLTVLKKSRL